MEFPGPDPKEHVEVVLLLGSLSLKVADVANVLELCFGLCTIIATFSAQSAKNVASFVFATHLDQPARGFRHQKYYSEEEQQWCDLECDRKAPNEL